MPPNLDVDYFLVGVDMGTASVRAGLFDAQGKLVSTATRPITIFNPKPGFYEQSSSEIWDACCQCIKEVSAEVDCCLIVGVGFDATCSLVAVGENDNPVTVSPTGEDFQDVIMWMDHRAVNEAEIINSTKHSAVRYVGGNVSIEMQLPKLLWVKKNLPTTWNQAKYFFDLPDFLTWKATGSDTRSQCSTVCKWNFVIDHEGSKGWQLDLLEQIGLQDLPGINTSRIGSDIRAPGTLHGKGLTEPAARSMGLLPGIAVGVSLIDAYAGTLGTLGCQITANIPIKERLVLICGTSTCHMAFSENPVFVPGVWGPYCGVLGSNQWVLEAGQSATGKLIDHVIDTHPAAGKLKEKYPSIQEGLLEILERMTKNQSLNSLCELSRDFHVWPDFHGNRSPLADPTLKGMMSGLSLDTSEENLAKLYLATIQSLCYGTRHVTEALHLQGVEIKCVLVCGGLTKNSLFLNAMASVLDIPVVIPEQPEPVLLGAAMLGACASGRFPSLEEAMTALGGKGRTILPNQAEKPYHERKYKVFLKMLEDQRSYKAIMNSS